ncbi:MULTISPECIES: DedA family protein [unclassified Streptomyces]|uniref:DedA family protein n=1 Tax=unclassified Streptomyces TaxID=2593676 RepID=UPI00214A9F97|nr:MULTISPECIES: VTT domain-containing protein [unclassified Streptomyces]MCX5010753.1 VTT domain-containing protein [Streptomyces sp. NBC_00555]MCX5611214.1 VTT domain-containing protein [Streptomyces sp. NBC_00047]UUU39088.1 VTT domain-containing protein [Streptomyces sp. NBC_00162]
MTWREIAVAAGQVPPETTRQALGYPALFVLVALGALVPVIPTGALVSSAAVVAFHQDSLPYGVLLVFAVSALAAFTGDITLYWLGRRGVRSRNGSRWLGALRGRATPERLEQAQARLDEHGVLVLVISRLVPAGRIPVMLACLLAEMPLRRFARGDGPACLAWAATYGLIGILGGSLFSEPWKGVALAVGLALLISTGPALWRRLRPGRA